MISVYSTDSIDVYGSRLGQLEGIGSVWGGVKVVKLSS